MISLNVNGREMRLPLEPDMPLLYALRDALGLTGTKYGCGVGICGICTVLIDNEPARACTLPIGELAGRLVTTIEGLPHGHPVIAAWIAEQVPQCGYCQPGQIMAAVSLLMRHPFITDADIDERLGPVLCRCGTYLRVRRAVKRAAAAMQGE